MFGPEVSKTILWMEYFLLALLLESIWFRTVCNLVSTSTYLSSCFGTDLSISSLTAILIPLKPALMTKPETNNPPTASREVIPKKWPEVMVTRATREVIESTRWCQALANKTLELVSLATLEVALKIHSLATMEAPAIQAALTFVMS
ncbi:hypothetical protein WICPIJ_002966 [Wickerhamomyces pijperi]|uniref:Uncharacterized protein n=1 Tax=Wickerhamomyces pijperi TaxID=599730 RepID=A0A9P8Q8N4_WICPI|nr:hypothetical protein WICPIJ_002966 [Wickerhamomyces pijperi]